MRKSSNATLAKRPGSGAVLAGSAAAAMAAMALWNTYRATKSRAGASTAWAVRHSRRCPTSLPREGKGRPVVLLHGNVVTAEDFELSGLLDLAAEKECHVVAFDRPGFGYSDRRRGAMWPPARQADLLRLAFAKLGIERPVVVGHSWVHARRLGPRTGSSGCGERSCPLVRLLPSDIARRCAIILASGDPNHWRRDPLYCRACLFGAALLPLAAKGMFSPLPVPERFAKGLPLRTAPTTIADPRRGSGYRRDGFGSARDAAPLSGTADARSDHGWHRRPRSRPSPTLDPGSSRDFRRACCGWFRVFGHMLHYAVPEQVVDRDRGFCRQPNNAEHAAGQVEPPQSACL